jgi:hypothetical protein
MQRSINWLAVGMALALGACGGGGAHGTDAGAADTGGGNDGGDGNDAGGGHDAGSGGSDAGPHDSGGGTDTGTTGDAGMADLVASVRADQEAICTCDLTSSYTSTEACANTFVGVPEFDACVRAGYAADAAMYASYQACLAPARDAHRSCIAATGGCADTARADCDDAYATAEGACTDPDTMAFADARNACAMTMIIGTGADTCDDTATASTMVGDSVFSGTTLLAGDHRDASCGGTAPTGPDVAHRWSAPADGMYTFDTFGSDFDTVLELLSVCDAATTMSLACNDDGYMDGRLSETSLMMTAGQTVQIVIDGYSIDSGGSYVVNIHAM